MATAITTVTKKASIVKTTKGSEKKWSEILLMNRRHDLQLPIDIEKYNTDFKRTYNTYQRQQNRTKRIWANKHETWYQDDFLFRNHLLKQLKPITRRFKNINSMSREDNDDQHSQNEILNDDEIEILSLKISSDEELPPLKKTKKVSIAGHFKNSNKNNHQSKSVFSKLICPKVLHGSQPRLDSDHHAPFLDLAQRFLNHKPEMIAKGIYYNDKQKNQKQHLKNLIENEQKRTRLAAIKFGQKLQDEKNNESYSNDFDSTGDDDYC
jgi:hypothetical protein